MAVIRGVDVLVSLKTGTEYVTLGGQKDATLSASSDTIDVTTKDEGDWRKFLAGLKSWTISCEGLYVDNDTAQTALWNAFLNAQEVDIKMSKQNSFTASGKAIITSIEHAAAMDDALTFSVEFQGTGALTVS